MSTKPLANRPIPADADVHATHTCTRLPFLPSTAIVRPHCIDRLHDGLGALFLLLSGAVQAIPTNAKRDNTGDRKKAPTPGTGQAREGKKNGGGGRRDISRRTERWHAVS